MSEIRVYREKDKEVGGDKAGRHSPVARVKGTIVRTKKGPKKNTGTAYPWWAL